MALLATMVLLFALDNFGHLGLLEPVYSEEDVLRLLHFLFLPLPWSCPAGPLLLPSSTNSGTENTGLSWRGKEDRSCFSLPGNLLISLPSIADIWEKEKSPAREPQSQYIEQ